jgi:hypothetical protein
VIVTLSVSDFSREAKLLSSEQKMQIASDLLESISPDSIPPLSAQWNSEIAKRVAEVDHGTAVLVDGDEVFAKLKKIAP